MNIRRLFFVSLIVALSASFAFADSDNSSVSAEASPWLAPDLDSVQAMVLAEQLSDRALAVEYTTTDIYNLLYNAMRGEVYNSTYSLPRIASYTDRIAQILYGSGQAVPTQSLYSNLREIHEILNGLNSGVYVRPDIQSTLFRTDPTTSDFITLSDDAGSILEMTQLSYSVLNQLHSDLQNNSYYLSQIASSLSSYNWQPFSSSYLGTSLGNNNSYLSANQQGTEFYVFFSLNNQYSTFPNVLRVFVPLYSNWNGYSGRPIFDTVEFIYPNNIVARSSDFEYFLEPTQSGSYIYLFDFNQRSTGSFCVHIKSTGNLMFRADFSGSLSYFPFNSDEYQQMKQSFYTQKTSNSLGSLDKLANLYASDDLISSKQAQQPVEDAVISDFSGSGSESLKLSDVGAVKSTSGALKTMVHAGGDIVKVYNVLRFQSMFGFFSNEVAEETETWFNGTTTRSSGSEFISDSDYYANLNAYLESLTDDTR